MLRTRPRQAVALLDLLIDATPVGLVYVDPSFRVLRANHTLARIVGKPREAIEGRTVREIVLPLADQIEGYLRRVLETEGSLLGMEVEGPNPEGIPSTWINNYYPIKDERGRIYLISVVVMDVSARKAQVDSLLLNAEHRERFIGVVAHDLRTPLTSISAASSLLRRKGLNQDAMRLVSNIEQSSSRMARMIESLLDFTKIRLGGGIPVERNPSDLTHALHRVQSETNSIYHDRELSVRIEGDFWGFWDLDLIVQLMGNLVENAVENSPEGSPIRITLERVGDHARFTVSNRNLSGPIPREEVPFLFHPFRRVASGQGSSGAGLGLGLYISREIARAHGGTIRLESNEEQTEFVVSLPIEGQRAPPGDS